MRWSAGAIVLCAAALACTPAAAASAPAAAATGSLHRIAGLVASGSGEALGPVAVSGNTVFAGAPGTALAAQGQGAVLVFSAPPGGWSGTPRENAVLTASTPGTGDRLGGSVSASGQTVAAGSNNGHVYVFTEPAGGWSGVVHQSATLSASDGATLSNPIVAGQTIVAQGTSNNRPGALYVFTEPPGGWSGALHQSAKLTASDWTPGDELGDSIAVSGTTIVAGAPLAKVGSDPTGAVYVFSEPAGGWSGTQHETAKLTGSDITTHNGRVPSATYFGSSVAISGSTVVASLPLGVGVHRGAAYLFTEPAHGWKSETETAKLVVPDGVVSAGEPSYEVGTPGPPMLTISGATVVVPGSRGSDLTHPAEFVFTEPAGGWSGTRSESATLVASDGGSLGTPVLSGSNGSSVIARDLAGASPQTAVADGPAYVFNQPAGGWSGTITESAKLGSSTPPPAGSLYLFNEPSGGWQTAPPDATLTPSGNPTQVSFTSAAASGATAVASGDGSAYVFTASSGGWSSPQSAARLLDGASGQLGPVAISQNTVAALVRSPSAPYSGAPSVDVFTPPPGGWSGQIEQAASLVASDGARFNAVAISGETVFAAADSEPQSWVYVFTEPAGGWSGVVHETARLSLPDYTYTRWLTADGQAVAVNGALSGATAVSTGTAYVFEQPSGGWSGIVPVAAKLSPPSSSGSGSLSYVYQEPTGGWAGVVHPVAGLLGSPGAYVGEIAVSGTTVAIAGYQVPTSRYEFCPCAGHVWVFSEPAGGWHRTLTAPPSASTQTDSNAAAALALDGATVFAGGIPIPQDYGVTDTGVFAITQPIRAAAVGPSLSHLHLAGLAIGKPRLSFSLAPAPFSPGIASFRVRLPRGLGFIHNARLLRRGVAVAGGAAFRLRIVHGALVIKFSSAVARQVSVQIRAPALVEARALRRKAHHAKKPLRFRLGVRVLDATGRWTQLFAAGRAR